MWHISLRSPPLLHITQYMYICTFLYVITCMRVKHTHKHTQFDFVAFIFLCTIIIYVDIHQFQTSLFHFVFHYSHKYKLMLSRGLVSSTFVIGLTTIHIIDPSSNCICGSLSINITKINIVKWESIILAISLHLASPFKY